MVGRRPASAATSARLMNCKGVNGEEFTEEVDFIDWGLLPFTDDKVNNDIPVSSGVRGACGGVVMISGASNRVLELNHFSSLDPSCGGDSCMGKR